ncbi:MAG: MATE family efflux transporter [Anaerolineae bacterium]|nr:MATE family efflux transporter [Anaerolineae bacterium]
MRGLSTIAVPIIIQQAITSVLNAVDVLMLGQLGEIPVAAVALANQIGFLMFFVLFGVGSGASVFSAQYWGKKDITNIRKALGIALTMSIISSAAFSILAVGFPQAALRIYTNDAAVIEEGSRYLRLVGLSYLLPAITFSFSMVHRSTGQVRLPTTTGTLAIIIKSVLSYGLIFGHFGLPQLGIVGAGYATIAARLVECAVMLIITYTKHLPAAASPKEMFSFDRRFLYAFLLVSMPVAVNETLWALGVSSYNAIYARIGTESVAAYNIASTIEGIAFVVFIGLMDACAIMVGNKIGAGDQETAIRYGYRSIGIAVAGGVLAGLLILITSTFITRFYNISDASAVFVRSLLIIMGCCLWIRAANMITIVGVLRAGGDTRFGLLLDAGSIWVIGVPTALLGAFVFKLSIQWVYLMVIFEELVKLSVGLWRVRSKRWIRDLTQTT